MANTDIQLKKEELVSKLQGLNNASLLQRVADFLDGILAASEEEESDWWDELPDSVKESYEIGEKQLDAGEYISVEELLKKYR